MRIQIADKPTLDAIARKLGVLDGGEKQHKIFGVKVDKNDSNPNTRVTYLADAVGMRPAKMNFATNKFDYGDWKDVWFVKNNFPCMMRGNGSIQALLNPDDYTKNLDGSVSSVSTGVDSATNTRVNAMSAIPLVWINQYEDEDFFYVYIADYKVNDDFNAFAHSTEDLNNEGKLVIHDYLYLGMYLNSLSADSTTACSLAGKTPWRFTRLSNELEKINRIGSNYKLISWFHYNLLQCLFLVMFKNTDSQSILGGGYSKGSGTVVSSGAGNDKGQFWGANNFDNTVKFLHMEDVWGNLWCKVSDIVVIGGVVRVNNNLTPLPFLEETLKSENTYSKYTIVKRFKRPDPVHGFLKSVSVDKYGILPEEDSLEGSNSTYLCDYVWLNGIKKEVNLVAVGGYVNDTLGNGIFSVAEGQKVDVDVYEMGTRIAML